MKFLRIPKIATISGCLAVCLPAAVAQTSTSILLLNDSLIEPTANTTTFTNPYVYQSTIQQLTCPSSGVSAVISSSPDGTQGLMVKDQILVSVTPSNGQWSFPANVCPATQPNLNVCFDPPELGGQGNGSYLNPYIGQDPDSVIPGSNPPQTFYQAYGVAPIQIGELLASGITQSVTFQLQSIFPPPSSNIGNTTLYLYTNCTVGGVSGPATVINNPPPGNPSNPVTETFVFTTLPNQVINFQYTVPANVGDLTGITEHVTDFAIDPATFDQNYTYGTSFSTASCFLHAGELLPNNNPACKMYQLLCSLGTDPTATGANCPASLAADEIFGETFDPPANPPLTLPDIQTPTGTFHTGIGLLMGPDTWTTGSSDGCQYTPGSLAAQQEQICPQNLLFNFFGPGASSSQGRGENVNSTFITVYGVPEPLTTVTLTNPNPPLNTSATLALTSTNGYWTNVNGPTLQLTSTPPTGVSQLPTSNLPDANLPGAAEFVAAPIQNISYGLTAPGAVPSPANEPIAGDTTIANPATCPTVGYTGASPAATPFTATAKNPLSLAPDGNYVLHYYAQDCAGTQELLFLQNAVVNNQPSWTTNFYTYPINVDTVKPRAGVPTLSPPSGSYTYGQSVTANYSCTDDRSGLQLCGPANSTPYTLNNVTGIGPLASGSLISPVSTTTLGANQTFTVTATDFAGNTASSQSALYSVGKATLTVTANNGSMITGATVPTLTYAVTGFVNGETAAVLSGTPVLSTTATKSSSAGNYPITISQGTLAAANYTFVFVNGTMSVVAPPIPILTSTSVITGNATSGYTLTITVTNTGTGPANNVTLTAATLGKTSATGGLVNAGTVNSGGGTAKFIVSVPGSAGADGKGVAEKYSGTYTGGTFSASVKSVTLP